MNSTFFGRNLSPLLALLAATACALATNSVQASAGEVLFVQGKAEVNRAGGEIPAERGTPLEVADQVIVGPASHAQIRMKDGALVALQPNSTLLVQDFNLPAATAEPAAGVRRSVLLLVKGGLRTITGLIGKSKDDKYAVSTPIAVIGVRGTDYRMAFCHGDCPGTPDGLYVGVSDGHIFISNAAGTLDLSNGEYAYVGSSDTPPEKVLTEPLILEIVLNPKDQATVLTSIDDCNCAPDKADGYRWPNYPGKIPQGGQLVAYSTGAAAVGPDNTNSSQEMLSTNGNGDLTSFVSDLGNEPRAPAIFDVGNAQITDTGRDPETGLRWGRWEGVAQIGGQDADLTTDILHWIVSSPLIGTPAIPLIGSADYTLIGNTDPTDNQGHVGALDSARLTANFTTQQVTNELFININDQSWHASGTGDIVHAANGSALPLFNGTYSSVTVNNQGGGNGNFAGFFTPARGGSPFPGGAGLTYQLNSGGVTVSGAAAFGKPKPTPAPSASH